MLIVRVNIWAKLALPYLELEVSMLKQLNKYGGLNSYDLLKSIAVITMIIDHIGAYFCPDLELLRVIGRLSYPLFAFCAGYNQKYNFEMSLLGYALLMTMGHLIIGDDTLLTLSHGSILFSIIILRYSMRFIIPSLAGNLFSWFFALWFISIPTYLLFSYGSAGIIIGVCGYLCASNKDRLGYKGFLVMSLFLYATLEAIACDFSTVSIFILAIEFLGLGWLLKDFTIYKITEAKIPATILMLLSRYALPIYFFHYELFEIISLLDKP